VPWEFCETAGEIWPKIPISVVKEKLAKQSVHSLNSGFTNGKIKKKHVQNI
jgi:hypothetical protein